MTFNIAQWKEGDDPQLIIDFINEVMDDLRYKYLDLCFFKDPIPNNYNYTDSKFNVLGEVISWEYAE